MSNASKADALTPCDLVVLVTIAAKPRHGYDLWKELEEASVKDWAPVSKPQIYYSLKKLQALKFVETKAAREKAAGPKKEVFAATRSGRAAMKKALADPWWAQTREPPPFNTWAALSLVLTADDKLRQTARRRAFIEKEIAREKATLVELEPYRVDTADLARSLIGLQIDLFETELKWLRRFENAVRKR